MYDVGLSWATEPRFMRLFFLYLIVVGWVALVRSVKLVRLLYPLANRKVISLQDLYDDQTNPYSLARAALANKLAIEAPNQREQQSPENKRRSGQHTLQLLSDADIRLQYLWDTCHADAAIIAHLGWLTLLLSSLAVVYGAFPTWTHEFNNSNIPGSLALVRAVFSLLRHLALGIATCVILYGVSTFFENSLSRRGAAWKYFRSNTVRLHTVVQES